MSSRVKNTKIKFFGMAFKLDNMVSAYLPGPTSYQFHCLEVYSMFTNTSAFLKLATNFLLAFVPDFSSAWTSHFVSLAN